MLPLAHAVVDTELGEDLAAQDRTEASFGRIARGRDRNGSRRPRKDLAFTAHVPPAMKASMALDLEPVIGLSCLGAAAKSLNWGKSSMCPRLCRA